MLKQIIDDIKKISSTAEELKKFARLMLLVFFLILFYIWWQDGDRNIFLVTSLIWLYFWFGLSYGRILKMVYIFWMSLALVLGNIMIRLVLILVFLIGFVPTSIFLRIIKKDLIKAKKDTALNSYWVSIGAKEKFENYNNPY